MSGSHKLSRYTTTHESGMLLTSYFCRECGSVIYKEADRNNFRGFAVLQAGTDDDIAALNQSQPQAEMYVKYRPSWVPEIPNALQMQEFWLEP